MTKDKLTQQVKKHVTPNIVKFAIFNLSISILETIYLSFRLKYLNEQIPLWYTMPWGVLQLASRNKIFVIPATSFLILIVGLGFLTWIKNIFLRYGESFIIVFVTLCNLFLAYSLINIIGISSDPFPAFINPDFVRLAPSLVFSFVLVYFSAPWFLKIIKEKGIVTDPQVHKHPGMLLKRPSARGGGLVFTIGVVVSGIIFLDFSSVVLGMFTSIILASLLGLADDIQNTNRIAKLKFVENPINRFLLQALIVVPIVVGGVQIHNISNPLNGILNLDIWQFAINGYTVYPLAIAFTMFWILWIMNVLSWSNGVDGQYAGIIGIAALIIAAITLRDTTISFENREMITLAAITAGTSFGLLPYTWHPSKIMWGFGAISAGILIATLSILTKAKVATALIVLAVPFLDGVITALRRILQKKSPMKGDRGHLHHLLLDRGWSVQKVAMFYWVSILATGYVGVISADKDPMLTALTMAGFIAFAIILINVKKVIKKTE